MQALTEEDLEELQELGEQLAEWQEAGLVPSDKQVTACRHLAKPHIWNSMHMHAQPVLAPTHYPRCAHRATATTCYATHSA